MIGLKTAGGWLDLPTTTISVEIYNPFFQFDAVPGTITYPFLLPATPDNLRLLNFPHLRADQGEAPVPVTTEFYVDGLLWRVGSLLLEEWDGEKRQFKVKFTADAADLQHLIQGLTLRGLDLGTVPLELRPDAADYALPTLRNTAFYGDKNPAYAHYLNYYHAGAYANNVGGGGAMRCAVTPFPRLVPLLHKVFAAFGWTIVGPWIALPEVQQLVLYSDRAVDHVFTGPDAVPGVVVLNRHVPDLGVGEVLVALQKYFALGYQFNSQRRELRIQPLRDVIADQGYRDREPASPPRTRPAVDKGVTLKMALPEDEQNKTLPTAWAELRLRGGKEVIETVAGTLHVLEEDDALSAGSRKWVVPTLEGQGASPAFDLGDESQAGLLLLFDRGLHPDSLGNNYPLATWGSHDFAGASVGDYELRWDGPRGLYAQWHQPWLEFLRTATTEERLMPFGVADLLALDPTRKEMVRGRKYLWEKVSLSLSTTKRLAAARFTYRSVKL